MDHEEWCDLLSIIQVKDYRKRSSTQIKNIASDRAASLSESEGSVSIPSNKKVRTGVLRYNKGPNRKASKHNGTQRYCVIFEKAVMPEQKYILYISKDCTGMCTNRNFKDGLGVSMESKAETVKKYKKSEK